jgi:hypothetical protein
MPAMLILDKTQALDRIVAVSQRVEVPEAFARHPFRVATFERIDVRIGAPALVLAAPEPASEVPAAMEPSAPSAPEPVATSAAAPGRVFAGHTARVLSWPAFSFAMAPQPEG